MGNSVDVHGMDACTASNHISEVFHKVTDPVELRQDKRQSAQQTAPSGYAACSTVRTCAWNPMPISNHDEEVTHTNQGPPTTEQGPGLECRWQGWLMASYPQPGTWVADPWSRNLIPEHRN